MSEQECVRPGLLPQFAVRVASAVLMFGAVVGCERAITGEPIADPRPVRIVVSFAEPCHFRPVYLPPNGAVSIDIAPRGDWAPNRCVASSVEVR